ncbi:hypothetical protein B0H13DRAFT_2385069 [Mycena leptocephala]|nr:hypothetical protein B0H13DRAFT_2385069 [Mycena leptocephala]
MTNIARWLSAVNGAAYHSEESRVSWKEETVALVSHSGHTVLACSSATQALHRGRGVVVRVVASCGGFVGISDAFGAALSWLDYALQTAHSNFSGAMFHFGGQNVFCNPNPLNLRMWCHIL